MIAFGKLRGEPVESVTYRTLTRRLLGYAKASFRAALSAACTGHAGLGPASLVLYAVTTLYFETDAGDGFRESGFPITPRFRLCRGRGGCGGVHAARRA
jgi:hypothetical protein